MSREPVLLEFEEWLRSVMGRTCSDSAILHLEGYRPLLLSRLRQAFLAGANTNITEVRVGGDQ